MTKLRLAIVGAGPAGIYAADILLKTERKFDVSIDLFEQLPDLYELLEAEAKKMSNFRDAEIEADAGN